MQKFHKFHLVDQSPWPLAVSAALFTTVVGLVLAMHGYANGFNCFVWGLFNTGMSAAFWFRDIIREATFGGHHTVPVQRGLRLGFALFVLSEVMFFFSFFWAFFYVAVNPAIELGGVWPPPGITPVGHWGLAAHNTGLLLLSGCTLTWSHYALVAGDKKQALLALVYKRWRERPQRPVKIWFFDVSKQVFGSVMMHAANVFMSMLTSGRFSMKIEPPTASAAASTVRMLMARGDDDYIPNPCSWYLLNLGVDVSILPASVPDMLCSLRSSGR